MKRDADLNGNDEDVITTDPADAKVVLALEAKIRQLVGSGNRWLKEVSERPAAMSQLASARLGQGGRDAFDTAYRLTTAAHDHLRAMLPFLAPGLPALPQFALFTLLRGASEAGVVAAHLLDPAIAPRKRVARELAYRLENLRQQRPAQLDMAKAQATTAERAKRMIEEANQHYEERIAKLRDQAAAWSIETDAGTTTFDAESLRGKVMELHGWYLIPDDPGLGRVVYRYLSGQAHAYQWAQIRPSRSTPSAEPGVSRVRK